MTLKIIGAGMGRTGTASLKLALETLGLGRCYHMSEVLKNPESAHDWIEAANGNPDWNKIFSGYGATVDNPGCGFWKELANYYPEAKVILTVRDASKWFDSTYETIHSPDFCDFIKGSPWGDMVQQTVYDTMDNQMHDREFMVDFFNNRTTQIKKTISADRLFVYEVKEGWESLCKFLDVPIPDSDFPRINSRLETRDFIHSMIVESGGQLTDESMAAAGKAMHED